jgi:hypothetical protein
VTRNPPSRKLLLGTALGLGLAAGSGADPIGPVPYQCFDSTQSTGIGEAYSGTCTAESPFAAGVRNGEFVSFQLDDWEWSVLNQYIDPVPTKLTGATITGLGGVSAVFSVDQDDGVLDDDGGSGNDAHTAFGAGMTIEIHPDFLPTHAGFVLTGAGNADRSFTVDFYGSANQLLGSIGPVLVCPSPGSCNAISSDDRFYGWVEPTRIRRIVLNSPGGIPDTWNFDHVQLPEPEPALMLLVGVAAVIALSRRHHGRAATRA